MTQARNIFVAFELLRPDKGDERIQEVIEAFGCVWARINRNVFYLHGDFPDQVDLAHGRILVVFRDGVDVLREAHAQR